MAIEDSFIPCLVAFHEEPHASSVACKETVADTKTEQQHSFQESANVAHFRCSSVAHNPNITPAWSKTRHKVSRYVGFVNQTFELLHSQPDLRAQCPRFVADLSLVSEMFVAIEPAKRIDFGAVDQLSETVQPSFADKLIARLNFDPHFKPALHAFLTSKDVDLTEVTRAIQATFAAVYHSEQKLLRNARRQKQESALCNCGEFFLHTHLSPCDACLLVALATFQASLSGRSLAITFTDSRACAGPHAYIDNKKFTPCLVKLIF